MTSIRSVMRFAAAVALVVGGFVGTSEASVISIVPGTQAIATGGTATVDILLSGLLPGETVGGFSFLVSFNSAILGLDSVVNDPDGKMGTFPLDLSAGSDLFFLADFFISEPDLKALEGTGFRLATLSFTGLTEGLSALTLSSASTIFLSDYSGSGGIPATIVNGEVCVSNAGDCNTTTPVPEPATFALFGLGAGLTALVRRRRQATTAV